MELFQRIMTTVNDVIWAAPMIVFCIGTGLYFSVKMGFMQIRYLKHMIHLVTENKGSKHGISSFQSLALSLCGRLGTGNIAGVATAIALGGPGALFWMWVIAFLGACTAFAESTLGQIYKQNKEEGGYRGGPSFYIEKGMGIKWYAALFSISTVLVYILLMPGIQANTISVSMHTAFEFSPMWVGIIMAVCLIPILRGGVKRISRMSEIIIPFMSIAYILIALVVIIANITKLPETFVMILTSAFGTNALFGGVIGAAIEMGVKRGIYSNEAGQGSQVSAAAAAEVSHPAKQGLVQASSIYIDTLLINTATGLMILLSGMYNVIAPTGEILYNGLPGADSGPAFTIAAIDSIFPGWGSAISAIAILFFAYTIFFAYYYIAETNFVYIMKGKQTAAQIWIMQIVYAGIIFFGAVESSEFSWTLAEIGLGIAVWLNLIALAFLSKTVIKTFKDYEQQLKAGVDPVFDPKKLGIKNADFWEEKKSSK